MDIPKNAKRVFKGIIFDVYHWQQKLFDGSMATYEGLKRPDSVEIIAVKANKIVLARQEQPALAPFHGLFAGRVDQGEEPLEAAKRELLEESGLESDDWELLKVYEPLMTKIEWRSHLFVARSSKKVQEPALDHGEKIEIKEVDFDEFLEIVSRDDFRDKELSYDICEMKLDGSKLKDFEQKLFSE